MLRTFLARTPRSEFDAKDFSLPYLAALETPAESLCIYQNPAFGLEAHVSLQLFFLVVYTAKVRCLYRVSALCIHVSGICVIATRNGVALGYF